MGLFDRFKKEKDRTINPYGTLDYVIDEESKLWCWKLSGEVDRVELASQILSPFHVMPIDEGYHVSMEVWEKARINKNEIILEGSQEVFRKLQNMLNLCPFEIVPKSLWRRYQQKDNAKASTRSGLNDILEELKENFKPEVIRDEYDLESQIKIFLQLKFPHRTIKRKQRTEHRNEVDILIDQVYCLELKVPENRTQLRNLGAQAEEYQEEYEVGIIIYQDKSLNLSKTIQEYVKKYKTKYNIDTIVYSGKIRK
jgi:hypothetical protein